MAREVMTLRLDQRTRRRLGAVARRSGRSASELARTALDLFLEKEGGRSGEAPFETIQDLVGCVRGGDPGRSSRGARKLSAAIRRHAGRRR